MGIVWEKQGKIFCQDGSGVFKSHATRPIPLKINEQVLRIFFASRDAEDMPLPTFVDVDIDNPLKVLSVNSDLMIDFGQPGLFDDSGITLGSIVDINEELFAYYSGWKRRRFKVTIEASIGVFRFDDSRSKFTRVYEGPILAQDKEHPFLVAAPFVIHDGIFKMWYCSGTGWEKVNETPEMMYRINYAESDDGFNWKVKRAPAVDYQYYGEVLSSPWVVKGTQRWYMWYSTRGIKSKQYSVGYAESDDGVVWERLDEQAGIHASPAGWDSEMVCYPSFYPYKDRIYMFYSGNGVGRGGIGYAVADNFLS